MCPKVTSCRVHERDVLNTSDHLPVSASIGIAGLTSQVVNPTGQGRIKWNKLNAHDKVTRYQRKLETHLRLIKDSFNDSDGSTANIDLAFDRLTNTIQQISKSLPRTKYMKHLKPYWDENLTLLKRRKVDSYRKWVNAGRPRGDTCELFRQHKLDKKIFHTTLKKISKQYENEEILRAVKTSELDRNSFWRLLNVTRKGQIKGVSSIRKNDDTVVHELPDVLQVWVDHFSSIGKPKASDNFDNMFLDEVSQQVADLNRMDDVDAFTSQHFTLAEVSKAIDTLHLNKSPGYDEITTEHLRYGGPLMVDVLRVLFNAILDEEYIPRSFRRGVQVPLYKGKDTCVLDPNNYRGITLLPTFNKVLEILIWRRIKTWWCDEHVISELQGDCRGGHSCVHTAFNLRETLATAMEASGKCFVAFFDVAKAFDTVWVDGLFKQMFDLGIEGKTWRLLYRCYSGFECCVKLKGVFSDWYSLQCRIHQGGFMSLMKYTIFINSLLVQLKNEGICCKIYTTPSTPLGYADDIAAACNTKTKVDRAMEMVYSHGCAWCYNLNAKKSGVLVYGESREIWFIARSNWAQIELRREHFTTM